jgi:hypothetical protein
VTALPAAAVLAHGVGVRSDLPLPFWLFAYGAASALLISFLALRVFWDRPRFRQWSAGRPLLTLPGALAAVPRALGLAVTVVVVVAAFTGPDNAAGNLAPVALYVVFWVGLMLLSAVVGDVWRVLSPWDTVSLVAARLRERRPRAEPLPGATHWPAAAGLAAFAWLELAYHEPGSPRVVGTAILLYAVVMLAGAARYGRGWLRTGDAFAAWFSLLAALAPLHRDAEGRLRLRPPFAGVAEIEPRPGTAALVFVALASTAFDGMTRLSWWRDVVGDRTGWAATAVATIGFLFAVAAVALLYTGAMQVASRLVGRDPVWLVQTFLFSLVPIALGYVVAHYFSLFVFEGQAALALASDPFGRGWDLFGTVDWRINYLLVSTTTISWVQAGAIVTGHVAGVVAAHDRAVEELHGRAATRSQEPLLAVMVAYTVGGLALLLGS